MIYRDKASINNVKSLVQNRLRRLSGIEPRWRRPPCLECSRFCLSSRNTPSTEHWKPAATAAPNSRRQMRLPGIVPGAGLLEPSPHGALHRPPRGLPARARWVRWRGRDIEKWDCIIDIPPISVTNPDSLSNYRAPQPSSPRRTGRPASYISSRICPLFRASPPPQLSTRPLMFRVFRHFFSTTPSPQRQAAMATASDKAQKLINENAVSTCAPSSLLDPQRKTQRRG